MDITNFRLGKEEFGKIQQILASLATKSNVNAVFLVNRNGQEIAHVGDADGIDVVALSTLAAGSVAATFGLASLIGEGEFDRVYLSGEKLSILISPAGEHALLVFLVTGEQERFVEMPRVRQAALVLNDVLGKCTDRVRVVDRK